MSDSEFYGTVILSVLAAAAGVCALWKLDEWLDARWRRRRGGDVTEWIGRRP